MLSMRSRFRALLAVGLLALGCNQPAPPTGTEAEFLTSPENEALNLPFSEAVRAGKTLYLSGQLGNIPGTFDLVPGGVGPETKQTLENIKATLERHGSNLEQVVKCTLFLTDIEEWPQVNEVYKLFFKENPPARSAVAGTGLALGARVEIDCIAIVN